MRSKSTFFFRAAVAKPPVEQKLLDLEARMQKSIPKKIQQLKEQGVTAIKPPNPKETEKVFEDAHRSYDQYSVYG